MSDITKHLGDERRLKLTTEKIKEFISKSTPTVNWYSHTEDSTVRGPFGRWFTASGDDKHLANIRDDVEYCAIAMTVLPDLVNQLEQLKQQLEEKDRMLNHLGKKNEEHIKAWEEAVDVIEFYGEHTNWETEILSKRACYKKVFKDCDIGRVKVMVGYVDSCGKRAREFIAKYRGDNGKD